MYQTRIFFSYETQFVVGATPAGARANCRPGVALYASLTFVLNRKPLVSNTTQSNYGGEDGGFLKDRQSKPEALLRGSWNCELKIGK